MVKKHEKTTKEKKGGIILKENYIDMSNLINTEKNQPKIPKEKQSYQPNPQKISEEQIKRSPRWMGNTHDYGSGNKFTAIPKGCGRRHG